MTDAMVSILFGDAKLKPSSRYTWAVVVCANAMSEYAEWQLGKPMPASKTVAYFRTKDAARAFESGIKTIIAGLRGADAPVAEVFAASSRDWSWRQ